MASLLTVDARAQLPTTLGPEYHDMASQIMSRTKRRYRPVFRQWIDEGLRISETIDNLKPIGASTGILVIVKDAASRRSALRAARKALPDETGLRKGGLKRVFTIDEHLALVRKNLAYIDEHVRPGYVSLDLDELERQILRDLKDVRGAVYVYRAPSAPGR